MRAVQIRERCGDRLGAINLCGVCHGITTRGPGTCIGLPCRWPSRLERSTTMVDLAEKRSRFACMTTTFNFPRWCDVLSSKRADQLTATVVPQRPAGSCADGEMLRIRVARSRPRRGSPASFPSSPVVSFPATRVRDRLHRLADVVRAVLHRQRLHRRDTE
jgi:hypothetical protein